MDRQVPAEPAESPAQTYERYMVPAIFAAWVPALLDLAAPAPGEHLLDLACGSGIVARRAAARLHSAGRVVGLDLNRPLLAVARASAPALAWCQGNAMALPFSDRTFNALVCQQALQFFPDPGKALREAHRVLAPGGRLAIAVWCALETSPGHHALTRSLERHIGAEASGLLSAAFRFRDAQPLRAMLEGAGFRDVTGRREGRIARFPSAELFARRVVTGSVLGRSGVYVSDETIVAVVREVSEALRSYEHSDGLAFPMESHLISARV